MDFVDSSNFPIQIIIITKHKKYRSGKTFLARTLCWCIQILLKMHSTKNEMPTDGEREIDTGKEKLLSQIENRLELVFFVFNTKVNGTLSVRESRMVKWIANNPLHWALAFSILFLICFVYNRNLFNPIDNPFPIFIGLFCICHSNTTHKSFKWL